MNIKWSYGCRNSSTSGINEATFLSKLMTEISPINFPCPSASLCFRHICFMKVCVRLDTLPIFPACVSLSRMHSETRSRCFFCASLCLRGLVDFAYTYVLPFQVRKTSSPVPRIPSRGEFLSTAMSFRLFCFSKLRMQQSRFAMVHEDLKTNYCDEMQL